MATLLEKSVTKADDDTWGFQCPGVKGDHCGERHQGGPGFSSIGWPTKKTATARGAQHFAEHRGEGVMQELHDFRTEQGLVVADDGSVSTAVSVEDLA